MQRCIELARKAGKAVKSNPQVGAVIVYKDRIIGEGYHKQYGGPHAEVNAFADVNADDQSLIAESTIYVSLEPCCIHSKTPPCTDAILSHGIKKVVVSIADPNDRIDGNSIKLLRDKGVEVIVGVLEEQGHQLLRPFRANLNKRPYVILKWAQSKDGYMGKNDHQVWLTNPYVKVKTHLWRSEIDGILVGHNTALIDDPALTTRLVPGDNPLRIILTNKLVELENSEVYSDDLRTLFIGNEDHSLEGSKSHLHLGSSDPKELLSKLYELGISRLMIEGGAKTLKKFISSGFWDEARVLKSQITIESGVKAPQLSGRLLCKEIIHDNIIEYVQPL